MTTDSRITPALAAQAAALPAAPKGYRPNVGIVLAGMDPEVGRHRVWIGERTDLAGAWQLPQGGIDPGEPPVLAGLRELEEETGVRSAPVLAVTGDWITYDFPADFDGPKWTRGLKGQAQIWILCRLTDLTEIRLDVQQPPEFARWRWIDLADIPAIAVSFKRSVYQAVADRFAADLAALDG